VYRSVSPFPRNLSRADQLLQDLVPARGHG